MPQQFSRQDLLAALEQGWKQYLSCLAALSEEEQARYAHEQGFARVQDMLAHIFAWWERSMQRSATLLSGQPLPPASEVDEFNAEVVARYQQWTRAAIEAHFATALAALEHFLLDLPETALEHEPIQRWMHIEAIEHYEEHCPPNGPKLRER